MKDRTLFKDKWLELRQTPCGYTYSHDGVPAGDGEKVAVLVFHPTEFLILGRFEKTPCHSNDFKLCSITGGVIDGDPLATAVEELEQEACIKVDKTALIPLGKVWPSKSSDTICHLYALPWTEDITETPKGDGSSGEEGATVMWVPSVDAALCGDPLVPTMMSRLHIANVLAANEPIATA